MSSRKKLQDGAAGGDVQVEGAVNELKVTHAAMDGCCMAARKLGSGNWRTFSVLQDDWQKPHLNGLRGWPQRDQGNCWPWRRQCIRGRGTCSSPKWRQAALQGLGQDAALAGKQALAQRAECDLAFANHDVVGQVNDGLALGTWLTSGPPGAIDDLGQMRLSSETSSVVAVTFQM